MNVLKFNIFCCYCAPFHAKKLRFYATKNYFDILKRDTEVHELASIKTKPKQNFISVFGVCGTGALGIKRMISNTRPKGNLIVARKAYPLYFFNDRDGVKMSVRNVACGYGFTLFSGRNKPSWEVYGCGVNNDSQMGFQDVPLDSHGYQVIMEPRIIKLPGQIDKIRHIACGRAHSVIVADKESVDGDSQIIYSFGNNQFGQCARQIIEGEIFVNNTVIHRINFSKRIKQVQCGEVTTYFLTEDGSIYGSGCNLHGQLANKDIDRSSNLIKLGGQLDGEVVKQISSRCNTMLALTEKEEVWAWGDNEHGLVFTDSDNSSVTEPQLLPMPATVGRIVQVSAGNSVCAVVDDQGKVHMWGQQLLGLGPNTPVSLTPKMIPPGLFGAGLCALDDKSSKVVSVQCGIKHCMAITSSGCLFFWGETGGVTKNGPQTFPVRMPLTFNARQAFIGADHSVIMGGPDV